MIKNTIDTLSPITRILHWTMSVLIISLIAVGFYMNSLPDSNIKWEIYSLHKSVGSLILVMILFRIVWRLMNIWPNASLTTPKWQEVAAGINIFILYCLMLIMPLSGFLGSLVGGHNISFFQIFTIPSISHNKEVSSFLFKIHEVSACALIAAIALHFSAALYHHFILKDNILTRMIKGR